MGERCSPDRGRPTTPRPNDPELKHTLERENMRRESVHVNGYGRIKRNTEMRTTISIDTRDRTSGTRQTIKILGRVSRKHVPDLIASIDGVLQSWDRTDLDDEHTTITPYRVTMEFGNPLMKLERRTLLATTDRNIHLTRRIATIATSHDVSKSMSILEYRLVDSGVTNARSDETIRTDSPNESRCPYTIDFDECNGVASDAITHE